MWLARMYKAETAMSCCFCTTDYLEELKALDAGEAEEDGRQQAAEEQVSVAWLTALESARAWGS